MSWFGGAPRTEHQKRQAQTHEEPDDEEDEEENVEDDYAQTDDPALQLTQAQRYATTHLTRGDHYAALETEDWDADCHGPLFNPRFLDGLFQEGWEVVQYYGEAKWLLLRKRAS